MEKINTPILRRLTSYLIIVLVASSLLLSCSKKDDTIEVVSPIDELRLPDTLKIISYNILEGMKNDRANNYNKFVDWIKSYEPDILALQEVNGFNQRQLEQLAARYGHKYVITNLKSTDNYPVALTSKYPLESRRKITLHTSHGAIFAKLVNTDINMVITHFWPQAYWKQVGDGLGDEYRLQETNVNLDSTIRKYPDEKEWLYMGDFNSVARKDYPEGTTNQSFHVTDLIESAGFMDAVQYVHGYKQINTANYEFSYPGRRIDFIFGTTPILQKVTKAMPIYDDFTKSYSDHPPFMIHLLNK